MKADIKYIGVPNICFSIIDKDDDREKAYSKQRIKRGFDDSETWNLDQTICNFILPRLKVFRDNHKGHPCSLTEDKWNKILDKMIFAFELSVKEDGGYVLTTKEEHRVIKGLDLFRKWFFSLWW